MRLVITFVAVSAFWSSVGCASRAWTNQTPQFESHYRTRSVSTRLGGAPTLEVADIAVRWRNDQVDAITSRLPDRLVEAARRTGTFRQVSRVTDSTRDVITVRCGIGDIANDPTLVRTTLECSFLDKVSGDERAHVRFRGESRGSGASLDDSLNRLAVAFSQYLMDQP
jgi:hypothetical protein